MMIIKLILDFDSLVGDDDFSHSLKDCLE